MTDKNNEITTKLGKRIIHILKTNPKISTSINKLEEICDKYYEKDSWEKVRILEWAYTGCVLVALNGGDAVKRLDAYAENIKKTLEHNEYSDPMFYVPEIYNVVFK